MIIGDKRDCEIYYKKLAVEFNLNLQTRPAFSHEGNYTHPTMQKKCEGNLHWRRNLMTLSRTNDHRNGFVQPVVFANLFELLNLTQAPPFRGHLLTSDNSMCQPLVSRLVEHSRSPLIKDTILLPIHNNQMQYVRRWTLPVKRTLTQKTCAWYGGRTGQAYIQSEYNINRTSCPNTLTDRKCIVKMKLPNISFGTHPQYNQFDCMLAIDGNGFAGSFKNALQSGQLTVRVGGFSNGKRASSYEWFEPFLRPNYHYIQTSVDGLHDTLEHIKLMPMERIQTIATNGQSAFSALVNKTSIRCYVTNTILKVQF
mmetsp:Transcript_70132/g.116493  ORF Transcript_70132/g.116493 Transcript_70132/m.116493 type:complete len:311 (+) Transcript_70132:38-970(+)|eukprot:CAMPEP_0119347342 /NCGR_PEP_ID=MMETSP1333-20130426/108472_1 /TAXON_ID=418940 /ORGANISM="Scyphosphaera apsteinii, Strain RCC1455" /LENGTH=310 /DNA_ID=CAMNT_0007359879 /DNA_START=38 /DNA_END=970 /DNA_ORIENTATION=+